jgi:hypothetical protein
VLKNNQWCLGCGHVFCLTTNSIMCKEKHDCESIELKGNIYMKDDLLGCQKWKRPPMSFEEWHCATS